MHDEPVAPLRRIARLGGGFCLSDGAGLRRLDQVGDRSGLVARWTRHSRAWARPGVEVVDDLRDEAHGFG
ncbi:hypothetical protein chiPu_0030758, partial [Chiloscyllium punctatum]|nr:hypothetical protein [Chiloscyllium punctatum]